MSENRSGAWGREADPLRDGRRKREGQRTRERRRTREGRSRWSPVAVLVLGAAMLAACRLIPSATNADTGSEVGLEGTSPPGVTAQAPSGATVEGLPGTTSEALSGTASGEPPGASEPPSDRALAGVSEAGPGSEAAPSTGTSSSKPAQGEAGPGGQPPSESPPGGQPPIASRPESPQPSEAAPTGPLPYPARPGKVGPEDADGHHAWRDGSAFVGGKWHDLYLMAITNWVLDWPAIAFAVDLRTNPDYLGDLVWPAPLPLADLTITGITDGGRTVHVSSSDGIVGTLSLPSGEWHLTNVPDTLPVTLRNIRFTSATEAWAQDDLGHVLRSEDGGATWRDVTPPAMAGLGVMGDPWWSIGKLCCSFGVFVPDAHSAPGATPLAWAIDLATGDLHLSSDDGRTWTKATPPHRSLRHLTNAAFDMVDGRLGWLSYWGGPKGEYGELYRTDDGGVHWELVSGTPPADADARLPAGGPVYFLDDTTGWIAAQFAGGFGPELYVTRDGGRTWALAELPPRENGYPWTVYEPPVPIGDGELFVSAFEGPSFISRDGGDTWNVAGPDEHVRVYAFAGDGHGLAVVPKDNVDAGLVRTTDGGRSWQPVDATLPGDGHVWEMGLATDDIGWATAAKDNSSALYLTTDGGKTWTPWVPMLRTR